MDEVGRDSQEINDQEVWNKVKRAPQMIGSSLLDFQTNPSP